jgi:hypothetical protein
MVFDFSKLISGTSEAIKRLEIHHSNSIPYLPDRGEKLTFDPVCSPQTALFAQ